MLTLQRLLWFLWGFVDCWCFYLPELNSVPYNLLAFADLDLIFSHVELAHYFSMFPSFLSCFHWLNSNYISYTQWWQAPCFSVIVVFIFLLLSDDFMMSLASRIYLRKKFFLGRQQRFCAMTKESLRRRRIHSFAGCVPPVEEALMDILVTLLAFCEQTFHWFDARFSLTICLLMIRRCQLMSEFPIFREFTKLFAAKLDTSVWDDLVSNSEHRE